MKTILSTISITLMAAATASAAFNAAEFPPVNAVPPTNTPQVQEWLKAVNLADVPVFPLHTGNPPACPAVTTIPADQCWRSCQSCRGDDITACPTSGVMGVTFDDGPTPFTPQLLTTLKENNIKATFFVMGTNVVRNPTILKQEFDEGHHIASHTWSHHPLTTLTNEEIVAELKWTEKAVFDITGAKMKYVRPPYGDIDNRVRAVVKKLGYIIVDWTSDVYDSKDFNLNANPTEANLAAAVTAFSASLTTYGANPGDKGIITLEHDLYQVTVDFAKRILPLAASAKLKIQSIDDCLGDKNPYQNNPVNNTTTGSGSGKPGDKGNAASSVGAKVVMTVSLAVIAAALSAF